MTDDVVGKSMVAGFLFVNGAGVLLVEKRRPTWQAGLLNGIGGVMKDGETPLYAMVREFRKETGYAEGLEWRHYATEIEPFGATVHFFTAGIWHMHSSWPSFNGVGERLHFVHPEEIYRRRVVGNLQWLVPLALDKRDLEVVTVTARGDIRERATW